MGFGLALQRNVVCVERSGSRSASAIRSMAAAARYLEWSVRAVSPFAAKGYRNLYHCCMKTTLNLNDQLLADAKALAAQQRTSLTRLIEEGLQLRLRAKTDSTKRARVRLPVFKGRGGLVKGVNPLSNKALLEALGDDA